jgi:hypothetical protein
MVALGEEGVLTNAVVVEAVQEETSRWYFRILRRLAEQTGKRTPTVCVMIASIGVCFLVSRLSIQYLKVVNT